MKRILIALSLAFMLAASLPLLAASNDENQPELGSWQAELVAQQQAQELQAAKSALIVELMSERQELSARTLDDGWARRMKAYFERLSMDQLLEAQELQQRGESLPEVFIGDPDRDLVFTPLDTPCRFFDSRNTAAGRLTPGGGPRALGVSGGAIPPSQGAANFCAVFSSAVAVVVNVLAVDPLGKGNFQMWPSDGGPGDSVINYGGPSLGINLINGVMVPICNPFTSACPSDLMIRTNFANSHAVINVTGYFSPPEPSPLECLTMDTTESVTNSSFSFTSPSCPAGYSLTGGGHNWTNTTQDVWFWQVAPANDRYRCRGRSFNAGASNITCYARCCRIPGEGGGVVL